MQEIRDPACLETLYRKLELSSRTRTAKRPRRSFPVRALHFLLCFTMKHHIYCFFYIKFF